MVHGAMPRSDAGVKCVSCLRVTAEVARRQADGSWLYLIDNPYAGRNEDA